MGNTGTTLARPAGRAVRGTLPAGQIRREFPALRRKPGGPPFVYLDTAATAQKPRVVIDRIRRFYAEEYAKNDTPYRTGKHATDEYERSRSAAARFLNARSADDIVFTRNTTEAINTVASGFANGLLTDVYEILVSELEHHSNIVPWLMACERTGAKLRVAPLDGNGDLDLDRFAPLLSDRTRLVSLTHVSNVTGGRQPVEEVVKLAHARGVPVLVDGAQAAPHIPVDVRKIGCDFYAFSGHKCYGPSGVGVLYGTAEWLDKLPPSLGGEPMAAEVTFTGYTPKPPPEKFAAGVPALASTVSLGTALEYLSGLGRKQVAAHVRRLAAAAAEALEAIDGVRVLGRVADRVSVVSFTVDGAEAEEVAKHLDRTAGIAVRAGHLSAQPLVRKFGLESAVRASFAAYSTPTEVRALADAVAECARRKGSRTR
jgi:cysteine desulfurase/selenocysteine lyase